MGIIPIDPNSSKNHGELKKLAKNFWSWWVPADLISSMREALHPTEIILCIEHSGAEGQW